MSRKQFWRVFVAVAAMALPLFVAERAHADAKYNRKTKDVKAEQTDRTKKLEVKTPTEGAPAPEITADKYFQVEAQVQGDVDQLIQLYGEELKDLPDDDMRRLDIGFRLAEAYAQKQRYHHSLAMEALMKSDQSKDAGAKAKFKSTADAEKKQEGDALLKAISAYKAVMASPQIVKYPQGDEVIFYYAFTLQTAGYIQQAGEVYKQLLKNFQGSKFVPDAYLFFADRYFENRDLANAEAFYTKVLQFPKSPLYPYAVYKLGWTFYNEKRLPDAMKNFKETISLTNNNNLYGPMNKAAKKDFVRVYAESDSPVNIAYNTFKGIDSSDYSFKMLGFLGSYYMDEGKADKAIYTYHEMMATKPHDPEVCDWQYNVVRATITVGNNADKIKELSLITKLYTALKNQKTLTAEKLTECRENAAGVTGEIAKQWHAEGLKTLNFATLGDAEALYKVYLENFPDAEDALSMQVNYSELLWNRATMEKDPKMAPKRWEATAAEHSKVVQWKGVDAAQRKESAYATVLAWKNALAVDPATDVDIADDAVSSKVPEKEAIPEKEQKMLDAFKVYLTYVKDENDEERIQIQFFTGRMYWRHKHYDEAVTVLSEVVDKHPEADISEVAFNVLLDSLNKAQRHEDLIDRVKWARENPKLLTAHPGIKANIDVLWLQSLRKQAEGLEKEGRYKECANAYYHLQLEYPNDPKINEILFNAAFCFKKAKLLGYAILFRRALTDKPGSATDPLAQKAQLFLGDDYTSIASYQRAAEMYELYAAKFDKEKDAPQALSYATFFRKGLGDDAKAIEDTELYVRKFARDEPRDAAGAEYTIANIYEKNGQTDKLVQHLETYVKQWGAKGGIDLEIAAHVRAGEALWKSSCPVKGEYGSCIEVKRERALKDTSGKHKKARTQTQCGPESKNKLTVFARKADLVKRAQAHFAAAIDIWKKNGAAKIVGKDDADKAVRTADAIRFYAEAQFYLNEEKYEQFLNLKFPTGLNFDPGKPAKKKESEAKFGKWLDDKTKNADAVNSKYAAIVDLAKSGGANINAAQWAIAGAAREGQTLQNFSDALFTAEIPKEFQAFEDTVDAYCDELLNQADPLEKKSIAAFSFCLESSNKLSWFNEWSQLCEAELAQIRPQDFPAAGEIRSAPDNFAIALDSQSILADLNKENVQVSAAAAAAPSSPPPKKGVAPTPATPRNQPKKKG